MTDEVQRGTHRAPSRGQFRGEDMASLPESPLAQGRFGRMFRNVPSYEQMRGGSRILPGRWWRVETQGTAHCPPA